MDTAAAISAVPELPPYPGIARADVLLVESAADEAAAVAALQVADAVGFDTESKPTFKVGEVSTGPHLIQLATDSRVFLFPVARLTRFEGLQAILESQQILKVGFGLESDVARLQTKLGIAAQHVLDLARALRSESHKGSVGAKTAVALFFGQKLQKSKKASTSNWANAQLTERQILYAADDAQVALRIYRAALASDPTLTRFIR
ncbi:MAG: 3'-5' exonuclease [Rhodocyclaceae bacterium]|nr:3'-5' exonuclease [Rhodocyclaceae bacterium]